MTQRPRRPRSLGGHGWSRSTKTLFRRTANREDGPNRAWLLGLAGIALLAISCVGERPYFDDADIETQATDGSETDGILADQTLAGDTPGENDQPEGVDGDAVMADPIPSDRTDCQTVSGSGPLQVVIESTASTNPCVTLAAYHRVEFVNNTPEQIDFQAGTAPVSLPPGGVFVTEPVGTMVPVGYTAIRSPQRPIIGLWVVEPEGNTMAGEQMGLRDLGPIAIGITPAEVSADLGGTPIAVAADACYVTDLEQDPYSPLLTVRDGTVAVIRVFAPGQVTRSGVGIGSAGAAVLAAYPERIEEQPSPDGDPSRSLMVFVPTDDADRQYRLIFELENNTVVSMRNGLADYAVTSPDCA